MKCVYCSNCGTRLAVTRKALPKYGRIIDLIEPHECLDEPVEFDLTPIDVSVPIVAGEGKNAFVQNLNKLQPSPTGTEDLTDRRKKEDIKGEPSSAPQTLLDNIQSMHNTTPANDMSNEPPIGE